MQYMKPMNADRHLMDPDVTVAERHLWLMFLSDGNGSGQGFRAYLESQPSRTSALTFSNHPHRHGHEEMIEGMNNS